MGVIVCGIDVKGVLYVINFDMLFMEYGGIEEYIYWIGCIGCIGYKGVVISFMMECDEFIVDVFICFLFEIEQDIFDFFESYVFVGEVC